jgi:hypothetical protein
METEISRTLCSHPMGNNGNMQEWGLAFAASCENQFIRRCLLLLRKNPFCVFLEKHCTLKRKYFSWLPINALTIILKIEI